MDDNERITAAKADTDEELQEVTLRPHSLDQYIGQKKVTDNLKVFIEAAQQRGEPLDHVGHNGR